MNYQISDKLVERLKKFLYKDLEVDSTCVETNELLDELENLKECDNGVRTF